MTNEKKRKLPINDEGIKEENRRKIAKELNVEEAFLEVLEEGMVKYNDALKVLKDQQLRITEYNTHNLKDVFL